MKSLSFLPATGGFLLRGPLFTACLVAALHAATPPASFDVRALGAKGDGHTLDTAAINRAIDEAAAAGGGTVTFPAGTYLSYSIHLRSHVALYLDQGARILAADPPPVGTPGGYDAPEPNPSNEYQDFGHTHWHNSLIWGENVQDVSILGPGMIDGEGLSRGFGRKDGPPGLHTHWPKHGDVTPGVTGTFTPGPFGWPSAHDALPAGVGNKAIALKNCRNIILRDFTIFHAGHFGILATAADNLTIDNLKIDTNRDGMDIDCCQNVHIANCTVNSPYDDGICLKSSFALGYKRPTENVTITNCQVSGFEEGSLLDGTFKKDPNPRGRPTGRIKLGTEANGGFKNIAISNCTFDYCCGLALEEVDGGSMQNIVVSNLTMRDIVNAPIYICLGARLRGPNHPPIGTARRIKISSVVASGVSSPQGIIIDGVAGHPVQDLSLSDILIRFNGQVKTAPTSYAVPNFAKAYPEPSVYGTLPAYGLFARHVQGLTLDHVELQLSSPDARPALLLDHVADAELLRLRADHAPTTPILVQNDVTGLEVRDCRDVLDTPAPAVATPRP